MWRCRGIERTAPLLNFDYRSRPGVTRPITAEIVPRVLTFLHARFGGVVGARPLTLQMLLNNDKSASERFPLELPAIVASMCRAIKILQGTAVALRVH